MVFQSPVLYDWRTVERNVQLPLELMRVPKKERAARSRELLELVGLREFAQRHPWELSGGSPAWGVDLCLGTVSEMDGEVSVNRLIDFFGPKGRIFYVHFRDVQGTVPRFKEAFIGEGNYDPARVLRRLATVGFDGFIIDDHVPAMVGDEDTWADTASAAYCSRGRAHAIGYLQGLLNALNREETQGVVAGLREAANDVCVFLPVDAPLVTPEILRALGAACREGARPHASPAPCAIARAALPKVEARLAGDDLSLAGALRALDTAFVDVDEALVADADTPAELRAAARRLVPDAS